MSKRARQVAPVVRPVAKKARRGVAPPVKRRRVWIGRDSSWEDADYVVYEVDDWTGFAGVIVALSEIKGEGRLYDVLDYFVAAQPDAEGFAGQEPLELEDVVRLLGEDLRPQIKLAEAAHWTREEFPARCSHGAMYFLPPR